MIEPLRRYAQFSGRARRAEYWWFMLFGIIASFAISIIEPVIFGPSEISRHVAIVGGIPVTITQTSNRYLGSILALALLCPQFAVGFRRLHDLDRTGWWIAVPFVLILGTGLSLAARRTLDLGALDGLVIVIMGICGVCGAGAIVLLIVWHCTRGTVGDNRFGPDPLADPAPL